MYGLRRIRKTGFHNGFMWPLEVGAAVTAPDWDSDPTPSIYNESISGLHVLPNAQGWYGMLTGSYWAVVEFDETKLVVLNSHYGGKVPSCKIVHLSESTDGLLDYFRDVDFDERSAHEWAHNIGDREYMKQFITTSIGALVWAHALGDVDHMKSLITDPIWVERWNWRFPNNKIEN